MVMRSLLVVMVMAAVVGCGGADESRNTGPTFGTICFSDACTYPDGDGFVTVYSYDGREVARCSWSSGKAETCWRSTEPWQEIRARDLAACRGDGPHALCP